MIWPNVIEKLGMVAKKLFHVYARIYFNCYIRGSKG